MDKEYREADPELLEHIKGNAWSIECMEGHEAEGRSVTYIGSEISGHLDNDCRKGRRIYDYYQDSEGAYWYGNRALLPSGEIVSMEFYIFGREIKRKAQYVQKK